LQIIGGRICRKKKSKRVLRGKIGGQQTSVGSFLVVGGKGNHNLEKSVGKGGGGDSTKTSRIIAGTSKKGKP